MTARGSRVFLAEGAQGVGEYLLGPGGIPTLTRRITTGGPVKSIALRWPLLAVVSPGGVSLHEVSGEPHQVGAVPTQGAVEAATFVGRHLWLMKACGRKVEVWSVDDPEAPLLLGEITEDAERLFALRILGDQGYTISGPRVERWAIRPAVE